MGAPDPQTIRQTAILAAELRGGFQSVLDAAGLTGPVRVTPYRDAQGILRFIVNLDGWQAVSLVRSLSDVPRGPAA